MMMIIVVCNDNDYRRMFVNIFFGSLFTVQCTVSNCLYCSAPTVCNICNNGYLLNNNICTGNWPCILHFIIIIIVIIIVIIIIIINVIIVIIIIIIIIVISSLFD